MTLETLQRVGLVLCYQERWKDAQVVFDFITDGRRKVLGPTHISTRESLAWLGFAAFNSREYQTAVEPLKEALADRKARLGHSDLATVDTMALLAECLHKLKRYDEAIPIWKEAISLCNHDKFEGWKLYATHMLGRTLVSVGDFKGAIDAFREAIEGQKKRYGPEHRKTLTSAYALAWAYADMGQYQAAEAIFTVNKEKAVESLGLEDQLTLSAAHDLGVLQLRMKQYAPAERNLQLAVTGRKKACGFAAPSTLSSLHAHFQAQYELKRYHDAERTYRKSLAGETSAYGHPSPKTLDNLTLLAEAYLVHSEIEKAQDLAESLVQERAALNGEMDESTQLAKKLLDEIYRVGEQKKDPYAQKLEERTRIRDPRKAQRTQEPVHRIEDQKDAQKKQRKLTSKVSSLWESTTLKAKTKATTQA